MPYLFSLILVLVGLASKTAFAAACCGGGVSLPGLILGDEEQQMSFGIQQADVKTDVGADGYWQDRSSTDRSHILKFDMARVLSAPFDRYQMGLSIPMVDHTLGQQRISSVGDVVVSSAYEAIPDWDYNPWRPKGVVFLGLTLPSGRSMYDSEVGVTTGKGFWTPSIGIALSKTWINWSASFTAEIHQGLPRAVRQAGIEGEVRPGLGQSATLGAGYSFGKMNINGAVTAAYDEAQRFVGNGESSSFSDSNALQRSATGMIAISRTLAADSAVSVSYADQSWFGSPTNTTLSTTWSVAFSKRWLR